LAPATAQACALSLHDALPIFHPSVVRRPSRADAGCGVSGAPGVGLGGAREGVGRGGGTTAAEGGSAAGVEGAVTAPWVRFSPDGDRKSTRLNSSHVKISYAVF